MCCSKELQISYVIVDKKGTLLHLSSAPALRCSPLLSLGIPYYDMLLTQINNKTSTKSCHYIYLANYSLLNQLFLLIGDYISYMHMSLKFPTSVCNIDHISSCSCNRFQEEKREITSSSKNEWGVSFCHEI